jgi:hypothetical protein
MLQELSLLRPFFLLREAGELALEAGGLVAQLIGATLGVRDALFETRVLDPEAAHLFLGFAMTLRFRF